MTREKVATVVQCQECGRDFDLLDSDDASEWSAGHDCEQPTRPERDIENLIKQQQRARERGDTRRVMYLQRSIVRAQGRLLSPEGNGPGPGTCAVCVRLDMVDIAYQLHRPSEMCEDNPDFERHFYDDHHEPEYE